jgi:hypothetical protein
MLGNLGDFVCGIEVVYIVGVVGRKLFSCPFSALTLDTISYKDEACINLYEDSVYYSILRGVR